VAECRKVEPMSSPSKPGRDASSLWSPSASPDVGRRDSPESETDALLSPPFRTREALQILGVSRRQLQYWAQTNLVRPSLKTRGGHHRYSFEDLVALKAAKRLIDAGVSVQRIRRGIQALREALPEMSRPLGNLTLIATGDVLVVIRGQSEFDAIQGEEWIFPVGDFQREVEAWRKLRAPRRVQRLRSSTQATD